ncbi:endonuclease domain-containing protein [Aquimarina celericrescens]|uniref:Endonuclease domain-containing protein n=1 Tax=Aquimarina celericrescens TaxID=1964542 RepID=A0ABW5AX86_9FLAO|nr:endonuclease domain-containing protein [Aquimarina celericrescens]
MKRQQIHTKKSLQEYRSELRKNMTPAEAFLWKHLKSKKLNGKKFQRQHSIENYIVDFYCASEKLVIELDGEIHNLPEVIEKDRIRTRRLNELGFTVIRFENKMVFDHLPSVLSEIQDHFNT